MKKIVILIVPILLFGENYEEIIKKAENSLTLKSASYLQKSANFLYKSEKGKNLPSLDASLKAARLKETPMMYMHLPLFPITELPMGKKNRFEGEISLKYPLFSGFAISSLIDKAKFKDKEAKLKVKDLKRNLYLKTTYIFSATASLDFSIQALKEAKKAITLAYKKAKGLYENNLLPLSDLYNIKAKKYEIEAKITETKANKQKLLNTLSYILNSPVNSISFSKNDLKVPKKEKIIKEALKKREDIEALKYALKIDQKDIDLAKSSLYPKVGLIASLKRDGDSLKLNGDGYTNADKSYVGASVSMNIFNGFSDKYKIEAAKMKRLSTLYAFKDYTNKVKSDIENAYVELKALKAKLKSAQMETKAKEEYYKLTKGRFENQLADADELSRSIADLAAARAKRGAIESQIFSQKAKILLMGGLERFEKNFQ